ncbi:MAG: hypothetical protein ACREM1_24545 [Longimicrobiales bacterium]
MKNQIATAAAPIRPVIAPGFSVVRDLDMRPMIRENADANPGVSGDEPADDHGTCKSGT